MERVKGIEPSLRSLFYVIDNELFTTYSVPGRLASKVVGNSNVWPKVVNGGGKCSLEDCCAEG
jgi:hypothetical protein